MASVKISEHHPGKATSQRIIMAFHQCKSKPVYGCFYKEQVV